MIWILKRFQNQMECHCFVLVFVIDSVRSQFWSGSKPNWSFTWNHSLPEAFSKAKSSRGLLKLSSWSFWTHFTVNIVDGGARDSLILNIWPLTTRLWAIISYDFIYNAIYYVKVLLRPKYEMREYLVYRDNSSIWNFKDLRIYSRC